MKSYTARSLISYTGLCEMVEDGIITGVPLENISGASIDITLSDELLCEVKHPTPKFVELWNKCSIDMAPVRSSSDVFFIQPNKFMLASSVERFNLPPNIAAEYKLKSSLARNGLNHLLAGWCDPCWSGSRLTLELHNVTTSHILELKAGMKIGQMVFWECDPVPDGQGYDKRGQYNNQTTVTASKGVR